MMTRDFVTAACTAALTSLLLVGCSGGAPQPEAAVQPDGGVVITDAWVRSTPNGLGAAYFSIVSPTDDRLVAAGVDSTIAGAVELHEIAENDGRMVMREVAGIPLPAGESVRLEPGGFHLMLLDMPAMLAVGQQIEIRLVLERAGSVTILAAVRESPSDMSSEQHNGMDPDMHGSMHTDGHDAMHRHARPA
jgi:periplasmic copper chaperone A